ncbi:MAG: PrsW family intramembrane metalloprotease [Planctomycetaceae bacterium]|jgi:RsiW-degrading membrane proteinase PrsW (M82 family)|nr:PrsW family intramembrane metalloprotease [Planctomycetaceae bacterium]
MNYYYYDNFHNKKGPLDWATLQTMAANGKIHLNTQIVMPDGQTKSASKVDGLLFQSAAAQPASYSSAPSLNIQDILESFKTTDYRKEIIPIDADNAYVIFSDPIFWVVFLLGVLPLSITSFQHWQVQLYGLLFFFAMLWGGILRGLILRSSGSVLLPIIAFFFTGIIGMNVMFLAYAHLFPQFILNLVDPPHNFIVQLFGYVFQVGLCEELCKIVPVLLYVAWKRKKTSPMMMFLIGVFSGLGFAAFENVGYAYNDMGKGIENFQESVKQLLNAQSEEQAVQAIQEGSISTALIMLSGMITTLLRSLSLVFAHSVWTGIFSYYLFCAMSGGKRWAVFAVLGLAVPAVLHGVYDWLCGLEPGFAALIVGGSFVLFFGYLSKIRRQLLKSTV